MGATAESAGSAIYDIGYRRYDGPRLGRGHAFLALYLHSLRTAFGIGRGARALILPWSLFATALFPAALTVALHVLSRGEALLLDYPQYFDVVGVMVALFCAAQTPELVSTDQRVGVLPLYFSRALRKHDYALTKLLALSTAVAIVVLVPLLVILVGRLGVATDFVAGVRAEGRRILPLLATPLVAAAALAPLSLALSALTPRRAIASAMVLGTILLTAALSAILVAGVGGAARWGALANPLLTAHGAILALFGAAPGPGDPLLVLAALPGWAYAATVAGTATLSTALLLGRYARLRT